MKHKKCAYCESTFTKTETDNPYQVKNYEERWKKRKYCKPTCARQAGLKRSWEENYDQRVEAIRKPWKDPKRAKKMLESMTALNKGKESPFWKDNEATYNSKHRYIQKHWKRKGVCEHCGQTPPPRKNGHSGTEWANKSGKYDRNDRKDWMELCAKCHRFYDKAARLAKERII